MLDPEVISGLIAGTVAIVLFIASSVGSIIIFFGFRFPTPKAHTHWYLFLFHIVPHS
jgi:hypothetical protein